MSNFASRPLANKGSSRSLIHRNEGFYLRLGQWIVMATIVVTVWSIAGYYPLARFVALGMLGCALATVVASPIGLAESVRRSKSMLIVLLFVLGVGAIGLVELPSWIPLDWTGVQQVRDEFVGEVAAQAATPTGEAAASDRWRLTLDSWATKTWLSTAVIGVVGFYLGAILFRSSRSRLMLMSTLAATGASQVLWGIVQIVRRPDQILPGMRIDGAADYFGTFVNRNHSADFLGMALASAIGLAWWSYRSAGRAKQSAYNGHNFVQRTLSNPTAIGIWLCVGWLTVGVISTLSRGGWLAVGLGLLAVPLCWKRGTLAGKSVVMVGIATAGLCIFAGLQWVGLGDRVTNRLDDLELEAMVADSRWSHWSDAWPAVMNYFPIGSGWGTYRYSYLPFDPTPNQRWFTHAHNQYLETLVEAGLPGFMLLVIGVVLATRPCLMLCQRRRDYTKEALGIAAFASLVIQTLHAFSDFGLMMPANLLTFAVLIGAAFAAAEPRIRRSAGKQTVAKVSTGPTGATSLADDSVSHSVNSPNRFAGVLGYGSLLFMMLILVTAIWHQQRCVRASKVLARTEFSPATPSPAYTLTGQWLDQIESELRRSPDHGKLWQRLIQLRFHRAQRASYDQVASGSLPNVRSTNPIRNWSITSLESVIWKIYNKSTNAELTAEERLATERLIADEPDLKAAWSELRSMLKLNPVEPRTHFRLAQLGAASGKDWRPYFDNSVRLSVVDPRLSLGNGLLAWAAGEREIMIDQFRQTLTTDTSRTALIFNIMQLELTDQEIVEHLTPNRWVVPYRMAKMIEGQSDHRELYRKLMERSDSLAITTIDDELARHRARGIIASAQGRHDVAAEHYRDATESNPKNPELRYRLALSLIRAGRPAEAVTEARIAHYLSPNQQKYRELFTRAQSLHRRAFEAATDEPETNP